MTCEPSFFQQTAQANRARSSRPKRAYPLERLPLLRYALQLLQRHYVDPTQFKPQNMFVSGLAQIEQKLPSFQARWNLQKTQLKLQMGEHHLTLPQSRFLGIFDVWIRMRPIAEWLKKHYKGPVRHKDIDYYIVKGMMSTLDKQSMFIDPRLHRRRRKKHHFKNGKIGVVLQWNKKKHTLSIVTLIQDGPADQAGLRKGDRIVRIEDKMVSKGKFIDALRRIQGFRGTRLTLYIMRKGFKKPKRFVLIRARIPRPNVEGFLLPGKIGYIRLRQFIGGSSLSIREKLANLRHRAKGSLFGLILDLRQNGGGLVREAVAICSLFVEKGEVTTYAGANTKRRTYRVSGRNIEERYPMIVLINGFSASASELLSGALRNHGRAVVMGQQSYGKGTVQIAGPLRGLGLFFRITIAQYLLPGDQSIQAVGVTPDIRLTPVRIGKNNTIFYSAHARDLALRRKRWPSFLLQNLPDLNGGTSKSRHLHLHYLSNVAGRRARKIGKQSKNPRPQSWFIAPQHPLGSDFEIWLARYLLSNAKSARKTTFLQRIRRPFRKIKKRQEQLIATTLKQLKLNWSRPRNSPPSTTLKGSAQVVGSVLPVSIQKPFKIRVKIRNTGRHTAYRVRAVVHADHPSIRYKEFLFGRIAAGKTATQTLSFNIKKYALSRVDILRFTVQMEGNRRTDSFELSLPWVAPQQPHYAFSCHIQDPSPDGNDDGYLQPGEKGKLLCTLHNTSLHRSPNVYVILRAKGLKILPRRIRLNALVAGEKRTFVFSIHAPDNMRAKRRLTLQLSLLDPDVGKRTKHRIHLQMAPPKQGIRRIKKSLWARTSKRVTLYTAPSAKGTVLGHIGMGSQLQIKQIWKGYAQVSLPSTVLPPLKSTHTTSTQSPNPKKHSKRKVSKVSSLKKERVIFRPAPLRAWLLLHDIQQTKQGSERIQGLQLSQMVEAPDITLVQNVPLSTSNTMMKLGFRVRSVQPLLDVHIFFKKKKIFYYRIPTTKKEQLHDVRFNVPFKLKPGVHYFRLTVRTHKHAFHRFFYITRTSR